MLCTCSCDSARKDLSPFCHKSSEGIRILIVNLQILSTELANFLYRTFDKNKLWDEPIEEFINADCDGSIAWKLIDYEADDWD